MSKAATIEKAPVKKKKPADGSEKGFGAKTILFNDDVHTFAR